MDGPYPSLLLRLRSIRQRMQQGLLAHRLNLIHPQNLPRPRLPSTAPCPYSPDKVGVLVSAALSHSFSRNPMHPQAPRRTSISLQFHSAPQEGVSPAAWLPPPQPRPTVSAEVAPGRQSLADRRRGHARHLHGGAGHRHRLGRAPLHRRLALRHHRRGHLGAHQLPGRQRHRPARQQLVLPQVRPQALPHDLRRHLHRSPASPAEPLPRSPSSSSPASFRAPAAERSSRSRRPSCSSPSRRQSAAPPWPSSPSESSSPPSSAPPSAAGSPTPTPGATPSTSTSPSASSPSS